MLKWAEREKGYPSYGQKERKPFEVFDREATAQCICIKSRVTLANGN